MDGWMMRLGLRVWVCGGKGREGGYIGLVED